MNRDAERLLTDKAVFWVVRPRLSAGNLSGLGTILSGSYIPLLPSTGPAIPRGTSPGSKTRRCCKPAFPAAPSSSRQAGSARSTQARRSSIVASSRHGAGPDLGEMAPSVTVHAFVRAPFDSYVHDDLRFWNASGLSVSLGATGVQLNVELLQALSSSAASPSTRRRRRGRRRWPRERGLQALRQSGGCRFGRALSPPLRRLRISRARSAALAPARR